jgi:hypothetical protein
VSAQRSRGIGLERWVIAVAALEAGKVIGSQFDVGDEWVEEQPQVSVRLSEAGHRYYDQCPMETWTTDLLRIT